MLIIQPEYTSCLYFSLIILYSHTFYYKSVAFSSAVVHCLKNNMKNVLSFVFSVSVVKKLITYICLYYIIELVVAYGFCIGIDQVFMTIMKVRSSNPLL